MWKLTVNNQSVHVYALSEVEGKTDLERLRNDPHYFFPRRDTFQVIFGFGFNTDLSRALLQIADHDANQIDFAVPQSWWDEYYKKYGKGPNACWSYESVDGKPNYGGHPLFWDLIRTEAEINIVRVYMNTCSEQVAKGGPA